jgi:hypothetical protein
VCHACASDCGSSVEDVERGVKCTVARYRQPRLLSYGVAWRLWCCTCGQRRRVLYLFLFWYCLGVVQLRGGLSGTSLEASLSVFFFFFFFFITVLSHALFTISLYSISLIPSLYMPTAPQHFPTYVSVERHTDPGRPYDGAPPVRRHGSVRYVW